MSIKHILKPVLLLIASTAMLACDPVEMPEPAAANTVENQADFRQEQQLHFMVSLWIAGTHSPDIQWVTLPVEKAHVIVNEDIGREALHEVKVDKTGNIQIEAGTEVAAASSGKIPLGIINTFYFKFGEVGTIMVNGQEFPVVMNESLEEGWKLIIDYRIETVQKKQIVVVLNMNESFIPLDGNVYEFNPVYDIIR